MRLNISKKVLRPEKKISMNERTCVGCMKRGSYLENATYTRL